MTVCTTDECKTALHRPAVRFGRITAKSVVYLDAMHHSRIVKRGVFRIPAGLILRLTLPVRVVPDQESALLPGFCEPRFHGLVVVFVRIGCLADSLAVADEKGVEMSGGHAARYFASVDYQHIMGFTG